MRTADGVRALSVDCGAARGRDVDGRRRESERGRRKERNEAVQATLTGYGNFLFLVTQHTNTLVSCFGFTLHLSIEPP